MSKYKTETIDNVKWYIDENNNRCSVNYFGSDEKAIEALDSLRNCRNCINCHNCSGCSDCSGCFDCSRCSGCFGCFDCFGCSGCSDCSGCFDCYGDTDLEKKNSDFEIPKIKNIHQSLLEAVKNNRLDMNNWHTCETAHCRAGWIVHLAGEEGYGLEKQTSPEFAAMQIYKASSDLKVTYPRFFDSNEKAIEDIEGLAQLEAKE